MQMADNVQLHGLFMPKSEWNKKRQCIVDHIITITDEPHTCKAHNAVHMCTHKHTTAHAHACMSTGGTQQ